MADNHRESWAGLIAEAERYRRRTGNEVVLITAYRAPQPGGFAYTQHGCGALGDAARRYLEDIAVVHKTTAFTYAARPAPAPRPPPSPYSRSCPPQDPPASPHWIAGAQGAPAEAVGGQEEEEKNMPAPREMESPGKQQPPSDTTGESVPPQWEGGGVVCLPTSHPRGTASRRQAEGSVCPTPEGTQLGARQGDPGPRPTPEGPHHGARQGVCVYQHRAKRPRLLSSHAPPQRGCISAPDKGTCTSSPCALSHFPAAGEGTPDTQHPTPEVAESPHGPLLRLPRSLCDG